MTNTDYFKKQSILASTLEVVNKVNNNMMSLLPGNHRVYLCSDSLCVEEGNIESQLDTFSPDVVNAINCSGLSNHQLFLKEGVPIMLLKNIDQSNSLCNGTRLQVRCLGHHIIEYIVLTGDKVGRVVLIPRMNISNNDTLPFRFQRRQFSLIASFAMTMNKSQGQTLSMVRLYYRNPYLLMVNFMLLYLK
ncbi:uncharacterized protein LOC107488605 [Arachis duranensis]|uniref:Uncharacterized protein LOC107488605 n=1 Tax=Arachis duranensis TaxID=130453 RepID=A0A6P4DEH6_ARADU|nr:uncharacterized protein LOC107488605 [Arachis duranensis]